MDEQATVAGLLVMAGIFGFIISREVRNKTQWRSTSRNAFLGLVASSFMVVSGLYWVVQLQGT